MDGAIGFSGEKSTGKVILEPMAKNKVEFVTLCNMIDTYMCINLRIYTTFGISTISLPIKIFHFQNILRI